MRFCEKADDYRWVKPLSKFVIIVLKVCVEALDRRNRRFVA